MRLAGVALALLLGGGGVSWAASQDSIPRPAVAGTVPVTALGPDEVLLELQVTGVSRLPGDIATVSVPVSRTGATPAAARAALAAEIDRIVAAARKAGVAASDVQVSAREDPRTALMGFDPDMLMAAEGAVIQPRPHSAASLVQITLREPDRFESLRDSIETARTTVPGPVYSLRDADRGAREARIDAIRKARAEAEDYAANAGMRVGRLVRIGVHDVSEQWVMVEMMRRLSPGGGLPTSVETKVSLSIDYALSPR